MSQSHEERNKSIVLEAFETLFNKRDYGKAVNFWSSITFNLVLTFRRAATVFLISQKCRRPCAMKTN